MSRHLKWLKWHLLVKILWYIDPLLGNNRETNETTAVARQRSARNNGNTDGSGVFYIVRSEAIWRDRPSWVQLHPCGGRVKYLHRDSASRRRRRKGKSQIWDSKIRDSDPRNTTLARASSIYKRQTRPLVREGAPEKQVRNCQRVINIWSWTPDGARHQYLLIDWPSVTMWLWLWLWQFN
jgi:hypothetical protein